MNEGTCGPGKNFIKEDFDPWNIDLISSFPRFCVNTANLICTVMTSHSCSTTVAIKLYVSKTWPIELQHTIQCINYHQNLLMHVQFIQINHFSPYYKGERALKWRKTKWYWLMHSGDGDRAKYASLYRLCRLSCWLLLLQLLRLSF